MEFNTIEEFWDNVKNKISVQLEECAEDSKLITLKLVGGQKLVDFYKQNEGLIDFELLFENILAGVKLEDIEDLIKRRSSSDTLSVCSINELLAVNLAFINVKGGVY